VSRAHWWGRAGAVALLVCGPTGLAVLLSRMATGEVLRRWQEGADLTFDDLVVGCALLVLAATCGWLGLASLATVLTQGLRCGHTAAGRLARRLTPPPLRRLLAGVCGAALLMAPAATLPATAAPPGDALTRTALGVTATPSARTGRLPVPDRPARLDRPVAGDRRRAWARVHAGDSLWTIAARRLPPGASDADVAAFWPLMFRHNRRVVGPDPDLIHPGTRLRVPPPPH
jgi:resuscitation-promoting factor RpfA